MQRAPWAKISISAGQAAQMAAVSAAEHSRASTTRSHPSAARSFAAPAVKALIWVLAWTGRSGSICRSSKKSPQSWTSTASTPRRAAAAAVSRARGSSRSVTRVLRVKKTRTPRS